jgi:hypothetical protein
MKCSDLLTEPSVVVPNKRIPESDDADEYNDDDEDEPAVQIKQPKNEADPTNGNVSEKKPDEGKSTSEFPSHVFITTIIFCLVAVAVIVIIIALYVRHVHQKKYLYATGRSVLTFSNPNYNASSSDVGPSASQADKRPFLWKRLKYDKSQVYNQTDRPVP